MTSSSMLSSWRAWPLALAYCLTVLLGYLTSSYWPTTFFFNDKHNVLNQYIVKLGWFWTTVALASTLTTHRKVWLRYGTITLYWFMMTQWCFGPSLIDRVFIASGGMCVQQEQAMIGVLAQATCRKLGGQWTGGHDVSGHCFMLIYSSLFLWQEVPSLLQERSNKLSQYFVACLLGLWWWMLLMTSVYFHGHLELLSGTFFGVLGWATFYYLVFPRVEALSNSETLLA
ncbi:inositol phospholipid synthesis and fat-storage-inducing TM-domain-containing protein [Syncephalastrum racemosum]|uniref:Inositol phospholipid synthesis and fat-storage-inducing TM-domain-containing protein n=1 Tax=Syncephalastrum racemosum TaxID=13706 RepID=A0A1X2H6W1_SYNRA|nr:inositol phospholipid synthesis and fat-storage-inducing TM-domain-containing protein [Syncephalastrum racemosum]